MKNFIVTMLFIVALLSGTKTYAKEISKDYIDKNYIILTFDDGPSEYSDQIISVLNKYNIKATFFVTGQNAITYPEKIKEIEASGSEVANHSFFHFSTINKPLWISKLDANLGSLAIQSILHKKTNIYRPPFLTDNNSDDLSVSSTALLEYGYEIISADIDSHDWTTPGPEQIIKNSIRPYTGIILFHDGGGDRVQTVESLPKIIEYYSSLGYQFKTVTEGVGLNEAESTKNEKIDSLVLLNFEAMSGFKKIMEKIGLIFITLGCLKILLLFFSSIGQYFKIRRNFFKKSYAGCSIIVPAYNEQKVVESCLRSLLNSNHKKFEVILVNDGSTDNTLLEAKKVKDKRLRIFTKKNGGKTTALNFGINKSKHKIIVMVDADTIFETETLNKLCAPFSDKTVSAVCGQVKAANKNKNLLTKMQSLEYLYGFNIEKRMGDLFNCITIIPGAIGAVRRNLLKEVNGFSSDTLAEDTDLTISIKEAGAKIVYKSDAVAFTELPDNWEDLLKQRYRWSYGILQALWKHRKSILNYKMGTLGMIGLPYMVVFHVLSTLVYPIFLIMGIGAIIFGGGTLVLLYMIAYFIIDLIFMELVFVMEKESQKNIWLIFPQFAIYRTFLSFSFFKSILSALRGEFVRWGHIRRGGKELKNSLTLSEGILQKEPIRV